MNAPPLWPEDKVCVYCGPRQPELLETVDGELRCIDREDCKASREAKGIRGDKFRFREKKPLPPDFAPILKPDGSHDWYRCPCFDCYQHRIDKAMTARGGE